MLLLPSCGPLDRTPRDGSRRGRLTRPPRSRPAPADGWRAVVPVLLTQSAKEPPFISQAKGTAPHFHGCLRAGFWRSPASTPSAPGVTGRLAGPSAVTVLTHAQGPPETGLRDKHSSTRWLGTPTFSPGPLRLCSPLRAVTRDGGVFPANPTSRLGSPATPLPSLHTRPCFRHHLDPSCWNTFCKGREPGVFPRFQGPLPSPHSPSPNSAVLPPRPLRVSPSHLVAPIKDRAWGSWSLPQLGVRTKEGVPGDRGFVGEAM